MSEELTNLLKEYKRESEALMMSCINVDAELKHWTEIREVLAKPHHDKLAELELKMKVPMLERASSFNCNEGRILYRKGAIRRSWNLDALDMVCNAKPEIKEQIWLFREEKIGEPSITVKVA